VVKKSADAIDVPLIVWGTANHEKDTEVLTKVCEVLSGQTPHHRPVEEKDYKKIAAAAIAYKHTIIASSPIDINLSQAVEISLLVNLGGRRRYDI